LRAARALPDAMRQITNTAPTRDHAGNHAGGSIRRHACGVGTGGVSGGLPIGPLVPVPRPIGRGASFQVFL
jgi:hypothetical protein